MSANDIQVGGNHYARGGKVQHWDLVSKNFGPSYLVGCATKYLARWRQKAGVQDLRKALHYIEKLREGVAEGLFVPPGKRMLAVTVESFVAANAIDAQEAEAIQSLIYWGEDGDLRRAQEITESLIAQEAELDRREQAIKAGASRVCEDCDGRGDVCLPGRSSHPSNWETCRSCLGSGKAPGV